MRRQSWKSQYKTHSNTNRETRSCKHFGGNSALGLLHTVIQTQHLLHLLNKASRDSYLPEAFQCYTPEQYNIKEEICLKEYFKYTSSSSVVLLLYGLFPGPLSYRGPYDLLVLKACIFRKKNKKQISRLFITALRAASISCFSSFWYAPTPRGAFAKPQDHHRQPFRAFLAISLQLFLLQTSLYKPFRGLWWAGRSHGVDSPFLFPGFSVWQTDTWGKKLRPLWKKLGLRQKHKLLSVCVTIYFLKRGREEDQVPSWQTDPLMRWDTDDPLKQLQ